MAGPIRLVRRGDIYRIVLSETKEHETAGPHYGIVVQADLYQGLSTALIVPVSSSIRHPAPHHVPLVVQGKKGYALVDQLRAVDIEKRLREFIENIADSSVMLQIDQELLLILGLHTDYRWLR